jgi:hypothetical protein
MDVAAARSSRAVDAKLTELFEDRWWGNHHFGSCDRRILPF